MFKNKVKTLIVLMFSIFIFGCVVQENYKSIKTSLELQAIQKKEFDTSYKTAFASTLSVFQDKGYVISTADSVTGFITANSHKKSGFIIFVGQSIEYIKATAFIETMPSKKIAIRLNFVNHQDTSSGYGMKGGNSVPIEEPKFYHGIFEKIQKAIFVRASQ